MFSLTGLPILVVAVVLAVASTLGVVVIGYRISGRDRLGPRRRLAVALPVLALLLLGQVGAVSATALAVNDSYGFYSSWADLLGAGPGSVEITTSGLLNRDEAAIEVKTVHRHTGGVNDRVVVWLPPGYDPKAPRPYPVVMFLPGQPGSPVGTFRHFEFAKVAVQLIRTHQMPPFVGVFPTLMISPPWDTECTDVPHGPSAETWLSTDVPSYLRQHYRVQKPGAGWSVFGWSTGAFCAAKMVTAHPGRFGSAVAFGGYFTPLLDQTTGNLFGGQLSLFDANSPLWLYLRGGGLSGSRLLMVAGRQDPETWPETQQMIRATAGDPSISELIFPHGGHNCKNYRSFLGQSLLWSASTWPR